jgi:hypothetical protein
LSPLLNNGITNAILQLLMTSITFADVSKAFDRVWIRGLVLKLERYSVKGELLCWLKSHLSNRCQRVIIKDAISTFAHA